MQACACTTRAKRGTRSVPNTVRARRNWNLCWTARQRTNSAKVEHEVRARSSGFSRRRSLSDFYQLRRNSIVDGFGAVGFAAGLIATFVLRWSILEVNFRFGDFAHAVFLFARTMLWWGIIGGVIGIGVGVLAGRVWQYFHMKMRHQREVAAHQAAMALPPPASARADGGNSLTRTPGGLLHADDTAALRFDQTSIPVEAYLALTTRVWPKAHNAPRAAAALLKTVNVGAWDGARLVGVVRMLTDGYFVATVPEVIVDPDYRRRGVGRELMNRALALSPGNRMTIIPTEDSVGFFQRLRCDLAPMGFVMRVPASQSADRLA